MTAVMCHPSQQHLPQHSEISKSLRLVRVCMLSAGLRVHLHSRSPLGLRCCLSWPRRMPELAARATPVAPWMCVRHQLQLPSQLTKQLPSTQIDSATVGLALVFI